MLLLWLHDDAVVVDLIFIEVLSLGQDDLLEKGMATQFSILVWRIPWTEEPGGLQYMRSQRVGHHWETDTFTFLRVKYFKIFI